ncbi:metallophosphoesterase family protein [Rhodopirellula halodulae]|uniref:metallophosphoesterase family protein n=1 Tax=Rhodopirellula halodulae TaxID=2894198 RepID=UPI001E4F3E07|nr:metallophosphoesterase [Rhodopirellula sp. JC737]MCC9658276.1 metallophosphoesterase [Rhodopirellula sp. JC737]
MTLRVLCFSDLHRNHIAARQLVKMADEADLVLGAGDFANRHEGLSDTLDVLCAITTPTVLVPGNGETVEELRDATKEWKAATVLHGEGCDIELKGKAVPIWGVGGGIPVTPFGAWSYDFDEEQAREMLADCPENAILITHSPALDTVDKDSTGRVRGSRTIREVILEKKPRFAVCGHIHDDWESQVTLGSTPVLNAGPNGVFADVPE